MKKLIKNIIDNWDPYSLLEIAPEDEYSIEIKELEDYIKSQKSIDLESIKKFIIKTFDFDIIDNNKKDINKVVFDIIKVLENECNLDANEILFCPVCGNLVETYDVCEVCNWENTGLINIDFGPNKMTLEEAIEAYKNGRKVC